MIRNELRKLPDGYMTVEDAAKVLDVVPSTVRRMCARGQLTKLKDRRNNHNVLIPVSEVEDLLRDPVVAV
jgi:excisionase family DNA binding protein